MLPGPGSTADGRGGPIHCIRKLTQYVPLDIPLYCVPVVVPMARARPGWELPGLPTG